jgi:hypothetical protein
MHIAAQHLYLSSCSQDMAAKVAESLGTLPFQLQADMGYMQHRSSLCVHVFC